MILFISCLAGGEYDASTAGSAPQRPRPTRAQDATTPRNRVFELRCCAEAMAAIWRDGAAEEIKTMAMHIGVHIGVEV